MADLLATTYLIGDPQENFYQLGIKDTDKYKDTAADVRALLCDTNLLSSTFYKGFTDYYLKKIIDKNPDMKTHLLSYSEGLAIDPARFCFEFLMPELISAPSKWNPNLKKLFLGCSSLFKYDAASKSTYHARILDFPMKNIFEKHERLVCYQLTGQHKIFSFGVPGMLYPGITAMNDQGLTLALHQKFSDYFETDGHSIFYIAYKILAQCDTVKSVLKLLKHYPSITYWGLNISTQEGKALSVDLCGDRIDKEEYDLKDHNAIYFANQPLRADNHNQNVLPYGMKKSNEERSKIMAHRLSKLNKTEFSHNDLIEVLGTPEIKPQKKSTLFTQAPLTITTSQLLSMNATKKSVVYTTGSIPKFCDAELIHLDFSSLRVKITPHKSKIKTIEDKYKEGLRRYAQAISCFERQLPQEGFHEIQMSMSLMENYSEYPIIYFYYQLYLYLHYDDRGHYENILRELTNLKDKLPYKLLDHAELFIMRIELILQGKTIFKEEDLHDKNLIRYYHLETKLNKMSLKLLKKLTYLKPEFQDVLYLY